MRLRHSGTHFSSAPALTAAVSADGTQKMVLIAFSARYAVSLPGKVKHFRGMKCSVAPMRMAQ